MRTTKRLQLCKCGCGQPVSSYRRKWRLFVKGHHGKGKSRGQETKDKISNKLRGHLISEETKKKISKSLTGKTLSEETRQKISRTTKGRPPNSTGFKGKTFSEEVKKRISIANSGEKNGCWKGGSSFHPYSTDWTNSLKKRILNRDKHSCQNPTCNHENKTLHVHHIDYNKKRIAPRII